MWDHFSRIRGGRFSTKDLGEAESLAVCLDEQARGRCLPFVTYDNAAAKEAAGVGVVTLDFLDTLAWLVGCGVLDADRANAIERAATPFDGWRRPPTYDGSIAQVVAARQTRVVVACAASKKP